MVQLKTKKQIDINEIYDEPIVPLAGMTQEETRQTMEEQRQRATDQQAKENQIKEQYPILGRIPGVREMYRDPEKMPQMMSGYFTPLLGNIMDLEEIPYIYKKGKEAFKEEKYGTAALRGLEYGLAGIGGMLLPISASGIDKPFRQGKNAIRNVIKGLESKERTRTKLPENPFSESDMNVVLQNLDKDAKTSKLIKDQGGLTAHETVATLRQKGVKKQELEQSGFLDLLKLEDTGRYTPKDYQYLYNEMAPSVRTLRSASDFRNENEMIMAHEELRSINVTDDNTANLINKILYDAGDINTKMASKTDIDKIPGIQERLNTNSNTFIKYLDEGILKEPNADTLKFHTRKIRGDAGHVANKNVYDNTQDFSAAKTSAPHIDESHRLLSLPGGGGTHATHSYVFSHPRRYIEANIPSQFGDTLAKHTGVPGEIAFARTTKRLDNVGNKLHHIEEIQSDSLQTHLGHYKQRIQRNKKLLIPTGTDQLARTDFLAKKAKLQEDWIKSASKDPLRKYVAANAGAAKEGAKDYFSLLKQQAYMEKMAENPSKYNLEDTTSYNDRVQEFVEFTPERLNYKDYSTSKVGIEEMYRTIGADPKNIKTLLDDQTHDLIKLEGPKGFKGGVTKRGDKLLDFDRKYIDEYKKIIPLEQQGMALKEYAKIPFQDDVKDWVSHIIQDQIKLAIKEGDDFITFTPAFIEALGQNMPRQGYTFYSRIVPSATKEALKKLKQQAHKKGFTNWEPPQYFPEGNPFANLEVLDDGNGFRLNDIQNKLADVHVGRSERGRILKPGEKVAKSNELQVDFEDAHFFNPGRIKVKKEFTNRDVLDTLEGGADVGPTTKADINGLAFIDLRDYSHYDDVKRNYSNRQYNNAQFDKETEQAWQTIYKGPLYQNKWYSRKVLEDVPFKKYKEGGLVGINHLTRSLWQ